MIGTPLSIVEAVRVSLVDRVLPQLEQATWLAGDVRSCIALLTYLEDALTSGVAMMGQANAAMIGFLGDAAATPGLDGDARREIEAAVAQAVAVPQADLTGLEMAGRALKAALSRYIAARDAAGLEDAAMTQRLRDCLRDVAACELTIAQRAEVMPPF